MRRYFFAHRHVKIFVVSGVIIVLISFRFFCRTWIGRSMNEQEIIGYSADSYLNFIEFNLDNPPPIVFSSKNSQGRKYDFVIGVPSLARPSRISVCLEEIFWIFIYISIGLEWWCFKNLFNIFIWNIAWFKYYFNNIQYLKRTIRSLIRNSKQDPNNSLSVHIVVLLSNYTSGIIDQLVSNFSTSIEQRILQFIIPPSNFYRLLDVDKRPPTYKDNAERIYWRKRQNLDFAYLIAYCRPLTAKYYLQMEDDTTASRNYISKTLRFIDSLPDPDWFMIGLAKLGLYGKLFKAQDMTTLAAHIYNLYWLKPVDWTVYDLVHLLCDEKDKKCRTDETKRFAYDMYQIQSKSLFQHIGKLSSLNNDVNKLSESQFND